MRSQNCNFHEFWTFRISPFLILASLREWKLEFGAKFVNFMPQIFKIVSSKASNGPRHAAANCQPWLDWFLHLWRHLHFLDYFWIICSASNGTGYQIFAKHQIEFIFTLLIVQILEVCHRFAMLNYRWRYISSVILQGRGSLKIWFTKEIENWFHFQNQDLEIIYKLKILF